MARLPNSGSIRTRMLIGSGGLALLVLLASVALIYTAVQTERRIGEVARADARIELYGTLSARISDFAVVAIEAIGAEPGGADTRLARIESRRDIVNETFGRIERELAAFVDDARDENELNRRATWSLGLARMRAQFDALDRMVRSEILENGAEGLRSRLDSFATQFSPLLNAAIGEEQRQRGAALRTIGDLRTTITRLALALAGLAVIGVLLFQAGLISPLLRRIDRLSNAARTIGAGRLATRVEIERRDELGLLFANVNRMAARLDRRRRGVDADRARLNEIVETRTSELRAANEALERIDANRRRFFSDVSHELRTPLTVILGETELALRDPAAGSAQRGAFETIQARARRLNRRIEDLLRIARSESGRLELHHRPVSLREIVREAVGDVDGLAQRRGIRIESSADSDRTVLADAEWTRQVLSGLLENAIRHSPDGGRLHIGIEGSGDGVGISVTDEGGGIPAEDLERVFERFDRGARSSGDAGFGVGLSLARWVMDAQQGNVILSSPAPVALSSPRRGPGTQVTLILPELLESDE